MMKRKRYPLGYNLRRRRWPEWAGPVTMICAFVALVGLSFGVWWSFQVYSGTVSEKVHEPELRWWTNETECIDWQTNYYPCTRTRTTCSGSGSTRSCSTSTYMDVCSNTYCAAHRYYQQERIDDPDWILNVLGEDAWGDLKMVRVYVTEDRWSGIPVGFEWTADEIPDIGDSHGVGAQREGWNQ